MSGPEADMRSAWWWVSLVVVGCGCGDVVGDVGPTADADQGSEKESDAASISVPDETTPDLGEEAALARMGLRRHNGSEAEDRR